MEATKTVQYALVRDGALVLTPNGLPLLSQHLSAAPDEMPEYGAGGQWLPVVNRDNSPFDQATHYRLAPTIEIEGGAVFRTYSNISKVDYFAKELGISSTAFRLMTGAR